MTTAARPTFEPAQGGRGKGEGDLSALSKQYSSRDLPGHTKLKTRLVLVGDNVSICAIGNQIRKYLFAPFTFPSQHIIVKHMHKTNKALPIPLMNHCLKSQICLIKENMLLPCVFSHPQKTCIWHSTQVKTTTHLSNYYVINWTFIILEVLPINE